MVGSAFVTYDKMLNINIGINFGRCTTYKELFLIESRPISQFNLTAMLLF